MAMRAHHSLILFVRRALFCGAVLACWLVMPFTIDRAPLSEGGLSERGWDVRILTASASDAITAANNALINGKYKAVERHVAGLIAAGKQKPEVMAKALLLRGMAYRNQGKIAQAIADFSNAEWLQKLRGVELRRLYAERALAYDAVGQKTLAAKDRQLAGANAVNSAVKTAGNSLKEGVRTAAVDAKSSSGTELFGGLGNLFGFGNSQKPKVQVKQIDSTKDAANGGQQIREIPTFDSPQASVNRSKLEGKAKKTAQIAKAPALTFDAKTDDEAPSNSAWTAKRLTAVEKAARQKTAKTPANPQKGAAKKERLPWEINEETTSKTLGETSGQNQGPVVLGPQGQDSGTNGVTSFFQNIFGGGPKQTEAPLRAGDDVIAADQVAALDASKAQKTVQRKKTQNSQKVARRQPPKVAPARKKTPPPAPAARSLYHIQLGAFGEAQAADRFVSRLNNQYKALIGRKTAMVVETDLGQSRRQYRVYLGPYRSRAKGVKSCKTLKKLGLGCSLVE